MRMKEMFVWRVTVHGGGTWWVVAPDERVAREVLLEWEVDPAARMQFRRLEPRDVLTVGAPVQVPRGAVVRATTATAHVREWLRVYRMPSVLTYAGVKEALQ